MKKIIILVVLVVFLAAGGAVYVAVSNLDKMILAGVEKLGPEIVGAPVTLKAVKLSPLSGKGSLHGLVIGNPKGFYTPSAFELGEIRIAVDLKSLFSDKIVIKEIVIDAPKVTYEAGRGGSNVAVIMRNAEKFSGGSSSDAESSSKSEMKIQIDRFDFTSGTVSVSAKAFKGRTVSLDLPAIHLTGLGKGKDGITPAEASKTILAAVGQGVREAVASGGGVDKLLGGVRKEAEKAIGDAKKKVNKALGGFKKLFR